MTRSARIAIDASLFVAAGPLIGLAAVLFYWSIVEASSPLPYQWSELGDVGSMLEYSYALGAVPAGLTGLIWSGGTRLSQRVRSFSVLARGAVGGLLGSIAAIGSITAFDSAAAIELWQLFGASGAIAGGVLAMVIPRGGLCRAPSKISLEHSGDR
jgi:hypothetical protein